jgi:erythronate-4-phosphate dehydrogenase
MDSPLKIVCDNKIPFLKGVLEQYSEVNYLSPSEITRESVHDADALLIRTRTKCNARLLDDSNVKFIGTATIGYDHIDTKYCESKKIEWINAPGCNSYSVMQYIASVLVTLAGKKRLQLNKMTIGIIGAGNVGSKVARLSRLLGMNVLLNDPPKSRTEDKTKFVDLDELISGSDIITFHVPLIREGIDKTFHMADELFFSNLKEPKILFNTSRGEVVKTSALKNAIRNGLIKSAVLDVWENEPEVDRELLNMADIATPHIAGYSADGKANGTAICVRALNSFFKLGMKSGWYPSELPKPVSRQKIILDCKLKSDDEIFSALILHTYNVLIDDTSLRNSIETFEKQRGNYHVRREFPYYSLEVKNCKSEILEKITQLGFNVTM